MVENPSKDKVNRAKQPERARERASESVTDDAKGREGRELWIFKSISLPGLVGDGQAVRVAGRQSVRRKEGETAEGAFTKSS